MSREFTTGQTIVSDSYPGSTTQRSIAFFVYVSGTISTRQQMYSEGTAGADNQFTIELESSRFTWQNGASSILFGPNPPTQNTWYHLAVVYGLVSGFIDTYVNGILQNSTGGFNINNPAVGVGIGAAISNVLPLTGRMAEVAKWNVPLTAAEIATLANGLSPYHIRPQELILYVPLVRNVSDIRGGLALNDTTTTTSDHIRIYK